VHGTTVLAAAQEDLHHHALELEEIHALIGDSNDEEISEEVQEESDHEKDDRHHRDDEAIVVDDNVGGDDDDTREGTRDDAVDSTGEAEEVSEVPGNEVDTSVNEGTDVGMVVDGSDAVIDLVVASDSKLPLSNQGPVNKSATTNATTCTNETENRATVEKEKEEKDKMGSDGIKEEEKEVTDTITTVSSLDGLEDMNLYHEDKEVMSDAALAKSNPAKPATNSLESTDTAKSVSSTLQRAIGRLIGQVSPDSKVNITVGEGAVNGTSKKNKTDSTVKHDAVNRSTLNNESNPMSLNRSEVVGNSSNSTKKNDTLSAVKPSINHQSDVVTASHTANSVKSVTNSSDLANQTGPNKTNTLNLNTSNITNSDNLKKNSSDGTKRNSSSANKTTTSNSTSKNASKSSPEVVVPPTSVRVDKRIDACLDGLNFSKFKEKVHAKVAAAMGASKTAGRDDGSQQDRIFKTMMDMIKSLEIGSSIFELYVTRLHACYSSILEEMDDHHEEVVATLKSSNKTINASLSSMKSDLDRYTPAGYAYRAQISAVQVSDPPLIHTHIPRIYLLPVHPHIYSL
jgi:hypothetical protein